MTHCETDEMGYRRKIEAMRDPVMRAVRTEDRFALVLCFKVIEKIRTKHGASDCHSIIRNFNLGAHMVKCHSSPDFVEFVFLQHERMDNKSRSVTFDDVMLAANRGYTEIAVCYLNALWHNVEAFSMGRYSNRDVKFVYADTNSLYVAIRHPAHGWTNPRIGRYVRTDGSNHFVLDQLERKDI
jgi:hypothetical protein